MYVCAIKACYQCYQSMLKHWATLWLKTPTICLSVCMYVCMYIRMYVLQSNIHTYMHAYMMHDTWPKYGVCGCGCVCVWASMQMSLMLGAVPFYADVCWHMLTHAGVADVGGSALLIDWGSAEQCFAPGLKIKKISALLSCVRSAIISSYLCFFNYFFRVNWCVCRLSVFLLLFPLFFYYFFRVNWCVCRTDCEQTFRL